MARTDPQVNFRIPAELYERLKRAASEGNRTLTAELVRRIEQSFTQAATSEGLDVATVVLQRLIERGVISFTDSGESVLSAVRQDLERGE